jgi:hypothetical protein
MKIVAVALVAAISSAALAQWKPFYDGYADVTWSRLTGSSTFLHLRGGFEKGQHQVFAFGRNETYDTRGTDLPFQYSARGTTVGVGYRYWLPGRQWFLSVTEGIGLDEANRKRNDFRVGGAGFTEWWKNEMCVTDLYAEIFYVGRAEDVFASARVRPGKVLRRFEGGRLWAYGVGQGYISGKGTSGTENRVEAGMGLGYIFKNRFTLNAEIRRGYSFRGTISERGYWNPVIFLAGNL